MEVAEKQIYPKIVMILAISFSRGGSIYSWGCNIIYIYNNIFEHTNQIKPALFLSAAYLKLGMKGGFPALGPGFTPLDNARAPEFGRVILWTKT